MRLFFSNFLFKIVAKYINSCNIIFALFKFMTVHVHFGLDWGTESDPLADVSLCNLHMADCTQITGSADRVLPTCRLLLRPVTSDLSRTVSVQLLPV